MSKYLWLLVTGQFLWGCARQATHVSIAKKPPTDSIQATDTLVLEPVNVTVDSTFIPVPSITLDSKCNLNSKVAARADGRIGYVDFDETATMYRITYTFPGLTDEQWSGYVCNLPERYKKKGLKVGFVGSYYVAYQSIKARHAADTPLFLVLEKIKVL